MVTRPLLAQLAQEPARYKFPKFTAEDAEVRRGESQRSLGPLRSSASSAVILRQDFREVVSDQILIHRTNWCGEETIFVWGTHTSFRASVASPNVFGRTFILSIIDRYNRHICLFGWLR